MARRRLDSWKEIAAYLARDVTTVRRWEKREGLPIHRHLHDKLGSVYAYSDEIDEWSERRRAVTFPIDTNGDQSPRKLEPEPPQADADAPALLSSAPVRPRWPTRTMAMLVFALVVVLAMLPRGNFERTTEGRPVEVAITPPEGVTVTSLALGPKGDQVAFSGFRSGEAPRLWIRKLDSISSMELSATDGAAFPFWSPDGNHVGFFAQARLKTISLSTREVRELAAAPDGRGGTWNDQDVILFAPSHDGPILRISASGGPAIPVTTVEGRPPFAHAWPEFLPGGRRFLYLDMTHHGKHGIHVGDVDTGPIKRVVEAYSSGGFTADGYLLFVRDHLLAQRFDIETLELIGEPIVVADSVLAHYGWNHKADFSTSRTGVLAVRHGVDGDNRLAWVERSGRELGSLAEALAYSNPVISPDGNRAVATVYTTRSGYPANLWQIDLATLHASRLTISERMDLAPLWSADAERLMFVSNRSGRLDLYERAAVTAGEDTRLKCSLPPTPSIAVSESWTRDGRYLTYSAIHPRTKEDVWLIALEENAEHRPLLRGDANESQSQVSPDGRFIAYASDESGRFEVYVQSFPELGRKWQVSTTGGADPRWRGDGRELFYLGLDRKMMAVDVMPGPAAQSGTPRALFSTGIKYLWQDTRNHYDVTPDGQRFLILAPRAEPQAGSFTLIFNWTTALTVRTSSN